MSFDLQEVGITLVVGAFVLFGIELILWFTWGHNLYTILKRRTIISDTGSVSISLALSFAVGMFSESAAAYVMRDAHSPVHYFRSILFAQVAERAPRDGGKWILRPLGRELAANALLSLGTGSRAGVYDSLLCAHGFPAADTLVLDTLLTRYYYHAKNTALADDTRQIELLAIQRRMNFAGTFAVCTVILMAALLFFAVTATLMGPTDRLGRLRHLDPPWPHWYTPYSYALPLLALFVASRYAYRTETGEFTRRVLGYYSSDVIERKLRKDSLGTASPFKIPSCMQLPSVSNSGRDADPSW